MQAAPQATEKTISFFNAYCTQMSLNFQPGQNGGGGSNGMSSSLMQLVISSQRVAVGAITHDNNWPVASHGAGETFPKQESTQSSKQAAQPEEPSALSDAIHTTLDVVGMIPLLGEVADGANAAMYAAEGDYSNAALSAAAMIPGAGNVVGAAKLGKRAMKIAQKAKALKSVKGNRAANLKKVDGYITGTHDALTKAKKKDSHHIIQDAAMKDLPGYSRQKAPAIQLDGPSTKINSPHYKATKAQRRKGGGTYGAERKLAYRALREANVPKRTAKKVIRQADKYFRKLGVTVNTPTRIPGNRPK